MKQAFEHWYHKVMRHLNVSCPGVIKTYFPETRTADIQPSIKFDIDGELVDPPLLFQVPVRQPRTGHAMIKFPVKEGDLVDLIFLNQSALLHDQGDGTSIVEPVQSAQHGINSCYALLQGETQKNYFDQQTENSSGNRVAGGSQPTLEILVKEDSKLYLGNASVDLLELMDRILALQIELATKLMLPVSAPGLSYSGTLDQLTGVGYEQSPSFLDHFKDGMTEIRNDLGSIKTSS